LWSSEFQQHAICQIVTNIHKNLILPFPRQKKTAACSSKDRLQSVINQKTPIWSFFTVKTSNLKPAFQVFRLKMYISHSIWKHKCQIKWTGINVVNNIFAYYSSKKSIKINMLLYTGGGDGRFYWSISTYLSAITTQYHKAEGCTLDLKFVTLQYILVQKVF